MNFIFSFRKNGILRFEIGIFENLNFRFFWFFEFVKVVYFFLVEDSIFIYFDLILYRGFIWVRCYKIMFIFLYFLVFRFIIRIKF